MADISSLLGAAGIGGAIGKAIVSLELETTKYKAELAAAEAQTKASTGSMAGGVSKYAGLAKIGFAAVGVAAVAGAAVAVKAAVDLNEQINKTKEVFKDSSDDILAWSKTTASAFGVSETSALTAASSFGQIFDAAGLAESQTSAMSKSLVELAADLSSFNNIDPTVSLEKLQAGLAGQARPLREVGVFLSAARVEAEAYGSGIAKVGEELTDAQKIQARYNLILEDTEKAQGDFGRTVGESLPNQMRVLKAEFEDTAAKLGQDLLPALLDLLHSVQDLMPVFEALFKVLVDIVAVAADFIHVITDMGGAIAENQETWNTYNTTLADLTEQFKDGKLSLVEFDDGLRALRDETGINTDVTEEYVGLLHDQRQAMELGARRGEYFQRSLEGVGKATEKAKDNVEDFTNSLEITTEAMDVTTHEFVRGTHDMLERAQDLNRALKDIAKEKWVNPEYLTFLATLGPEHLVAFAKLNEDKQRDMQADWEESTRLTKKNNTQIEDLIATLDGLDKGDTKHKVTIQYQYEGYDPSKPGMTNNTPSETRRTGP